MYHFIEITCLQDEGVSTGFVMGKVMDVLHLSLVNLQKRLGKNPVGIGFPGYSYRVEDESSQSRQGKSQGDIPNTHSSWIGNKIRLFCRDAEHLQALELDKQLQRFSDYVHIRSLSNIDRQNLNFALFQRVQPKASRERLIRRQIKRKNQPENVIRMQYQGFTEKQTSLPFVNMKSHTSGRRFRLFVYKFPAKPGDADWSFSSYGLSNTIPVPDF